MCACLFVCCRDVSDYRMMGCMPPPPPLRGPRGGGGGRGPPVGPRSYGECGGTWGHGGVRFPGWLNPDPCWSLCCSVDYDYDYYGYSDYRGGYADPYYEDYYGRYDDYYDYGYPAAAPPRGRPAPERVGGYSFPSFSSSCRRLAYPSGRESGRPRGG